MSQRRNRKASRSAGNIQAEGVYDPFPRSGLVKQYERFIRKHVREFCAGYPGLQYDLISRSRKKTFSAFRSDIQVTRTIEDALTK